MKWTVGKCSKCIYKAEKVVVPVRDYTGNKNPADISAVNVTVTFSRHVQYVHTTILLPAMALSVIMISALLLPPHSEGTRHKTLADTVSLSSLYLLSPLYG